MSTRNLALAMLTLLLSTAFALDGMSLTTLAAFTRTATNDNSQLSTAAFGVTGTNAGAALLSITDALPGDFISRDVTLTTTGSGTLTLNIAPGSPPGVAVPLSNAAPDDRALMVRVEQCDSTFATAACTGVTGLNGGSSPGIASGASLSTSSSVTFNAAAASSPLTLQTAQPSGTYYYKVWLKIPANTTSGGVNSDLTFQNTNVSVTFTWQLTSVTGSLRNAP